MEKLLRVCKLLLTFCNSLKLWIEKYICLYDAEGIGANHKMTIVIISLIVIVVIPNVFHALGVLKKSKEAPHLTNEKEFQGTYVLV